VDVYIYEPNGISFVQTTNAFGERFIGLTKMNTTKEKVRKKRFGSDALVAQRNKHKLRP
jgi:hypothetical protein